VNLSYKYRLYPNRAQRELLDRMLEIHRSIYNDALTERRLAWERSQISISYYDQANQLKAICEFDEDAAWCNYSSLQQTLRRLHKSFDPDYRYRPNELYEFLSRRLFTGRLHKATEYFTHFTRRGTRDRSAALRRQLEIAQERARAKWGVEARSRIHVRSRSPVGCGSLQAVDYCLWALQRLYGRREDRYIQVLWPLYSLVMDIEDRRTANYGTYYTRKRPLSLAALEDVLGI